jgi:steroid 5-alpha reductase family enzyme
MDLNLFQTILVCAFAAILFLSAVFVFAQQKKRFDLIDSAWGMTFIVITITGAIVHGFSAPILLISGLVAIWGTRLSYHIFRRFIRSDHEDKRYIELRKKWQGNLAVNAYFRIYIVQAILATLVCLSVIILQYYKATFSPIIMIGLIVWVIGFLFESIGDRQLKQHLANPKNKGKLMTTGLWRYTRHPNYFGEATMWWGIWVMTLATPGWAIALISPLLITYLLVFVSGVKATEAQFKGRPGWKEYQDRTSVFLPLPPKRV